MKWMLVVVLGVAVSGCQLRHSEVAERPVGGYQTRHHTVTYDTEPACVGSCAERDR